MGDIRLDKYLADMGIGSRSEVKAFIRKGAVTVNENVVRSPDCKIAPESDEVCYNHKRVNYLKYEYYMLHKPSGCVSATVDQRHKTVLDYIDTRRKDLFPVGRLDCDTEGLLLITNDGELAHALLSPRRHVKKTYYARVRGVVTDADVEAFLRGLDIGDEKAALPAELTVLSSGDISEITVTLTEGRYHQVKRMFEAVGKDVVYLKRISMGGVCLDEALRPGSYRRLTEEELAKLRKQE